MTVISIPSNLSSSFIEKGSETSGRGIFIVCYSLYSTFGLCECANSSPYWFGGGVLLVHFLISAGCKSSLYE